MKGIELLTAIAWLCSFVMTLYTAYFFVIALFTLRKRKKYPQAQPQKRFAVLVAARNEEAVIGNLVETLVRQNYPRELFDVIVVPNNCTDHTAQAAAQAGATVLECTVPTSSKGQVLDFTIQKLFAGHTPYDAICVFDADNLVHPNFLREMNNALCTGVRVAQGFRDSKNPTDTAISGCYSIYYWMINNFYSRSRANLGLSAIINGSGFMVSTDLLRQCGGWKTVTMTEDIEFTAQCVLRGEQVAWVPEAVTFDEQPLTFAQSWKQRKRWSTGMIQGMEVYTGRLAAGALKGSRGCFDSMMFFILPVIQIFGVASVILGLAFHLLGVNYGLFPQTSIYYQMFFSFNASFFVTFLGALLGVLSAGKKPLPMLKAMLFYWVFIMSWMPINIICLFKKTATWDEIRHTRSISFSQLFDQSIR